jgi:hypothetical protein
MEYYEAALKNLRQAAAMHSEETSLFDEVVA